LEPQRDSKDALQKSETKYRSIKFKKLIPQWLNRDFGGIYFSHRVENKILSIHIWQDRKSFSLKFFRFEGKMKISYTVWKNVTNAEHKTFDTVTDAYNWLFKRLRQDGLLNKEELMIRDIIT
jgi:hypothetical protein